MADSLRDKILETLMDHHVAGFAGVDGDTYPLVDLCTPEGSSDVGPGVHALTCLADEIAIALSGTEGLEDQLTEKG